MRINTQKEIMFNFELTMSIKDLLFTQGGRESFGNGP